VFFYLLVNEVDQIYTRRAVAPKRLVMIIITIAETLGPLNQSWIAFFSELGRKIASISRDNREPSFLFQCISITIQRFNSILLHSSFSSDDE